MNHHPNFWRYEASINTNEPYPDNSRDAEAGREGDSFMPHERDELPEKSNRAAHSNRQKRRLRDVIRQAAHDIMHGLRDTERRGIPSDVPGPSSPVQNDELTQLRMDASSTDTPSVLRRGRDKPAG